MSSAPTAQSSPTAKPVPFEDLSEEAKQLKTELENAGGIDAPDEKFETPLMRALSDKDNARVRMLLDIGANPSCIITRPHPDFKPGSPYEKNGPPPWYSRWTTPRLFVCCWTRARTRTGGINILLILESALMVSGAKIFSTSSRGTVQVSI